MNLIEENTLLVNEGVITQVMINRPQTLNAVTIDIFQGLINAFEKIEKSSDVRVITLWGAGNEAFATGAEVTGYQDLGARALADYVELGGRAIRKIERCHVPVIAAVNGYCLGAGLEIALAADIIIASNKAVFASPEVSLGGIPSFGGLQRLVQRVGVGAAKKMLYSANLVQVEAALRMSLVDEIAQDGQLTNCVDLLAENISKQAPLAVQRIKKLLNSDESILGQDRLCVEAYLELAKTADWEEGLSAFMQQREPRFTGR